MKKTGKRIKGIVVLLLIVVLLQGSMVSTYNDEYKLVLQFGKVVRVVETPGLSFKIPFLQTTQSIPNYEMIYDLIPSEVNTRDKKVMVTDSFAFGVSQIRWHTFPDSEQTRQMRKAEFPLLYTML